MRWIRFFAVIPALLLGLAWAEASVTISTDSGSYGDTAHADCGWAVVGSAHSTVSTTPAIPLSATVVASSGGVCTASTIVTRSQSWFDYKFSDQRPASSYSQAQNFGNVWFRVSEATPYTFAGYFNSTGSETAYLTTELDMVANSGPNEFRSENTSPAGSARLQVGSTVNTGGIDSFSGSLTGVLQPGLYEFSYNAYLSSSDPSPPDTGATAVGELSLYFGSAPAVPEPTTIIIWSLLGSLGIAIGWWRRRR